MIITKWRSVQDGRKDIYLEDTFRHEIDKWFSITQLCYPGTVGNQADMTESSIFQRSNIAMNTSMVSLSYPKNIFPEIKLNSGKVRGQKIWS